MRVVKEIISWGSHIVAAVFLAVLINVFIIQPTNVEGCSMEATLHDSDRILISKIPHTLNSEPEYGDIVVVDSRVERQHNIIDDLTDTLRYNLITHFLFGEREGVYWIKRVIGKPGDVLEFKQGKVIRNGSELEEPYVKKEMRYFSDKKVTVPENQVFVMGDNRNNSMDSRVIGCIPFSHVVGKYLFRF